MLLESICACHHSPSARGRDLCAAGTLQRRCPGWRELNCGSQNQTKAVVLPFVQMSNVGSSSQGCVGMEVALCVCAATGAPHQSRSAAWAALAPLCCPWFENSGDL